MTAAHSDRSLDGLFRWIRRHRGFVNALIFLILLYVVVPQMGTFKQSFAAMFDAQPLYIGWAIVFTVLTYVVSAVLYQLLAKQRLNFWRTLVIRISSAFVNRLLPAGIGGIGLSVQYLRKSKHTTTQAGVVVATNNLLGFVGHMLLVLIVVAVSDVTLRAVHFPGQWFWYGGVVASAVSITIGLVVFSRLKRKVVYLAAEIGRDIFSYRHHPLRLLSALILSMSLTVFYALTLYACSEALALNISVTDAFIIFTLGMFTGTISPTPGGLVGMEAGLIAGFIAVGVPADAALAVTLIYRLLTYWLPILPGITAFHVAERRRYV